MTITHQVMVIEDMKKLLVIAMDFLKQFKAMINILRRSLQYASLSETLKLSKIKACHTEINHKYYRAELNGYDIQDTSLTLKKISHVKIIRYSHMNPQKLK